VIDGRRPRLATRVAVAALLFLAACDGGEGGAATPSEEPRTGFGNMGLPVPSSETELIGPDTFPCTPETSTMGYTRYGVGPMRRGGWEREELEPDHLLIQGKGINFHGRVSVDDGDTLEMEMDEDYFAPSVVTGPPGATVMIELENDGTRAHNFKVPGQGINLLCGVRSHDEVTVRFPRSGTLLFRCTLGRGSGMRGALVASR
jgi:plastocyanin